MIALRSLLAVLAVSGCAGISGGPPPNVSNISVTYCDGALKTRLVRVGIGGSNNIGETEPVDIACEDNDKPLGCTFSGVTPGTYRVQDGPWTALVFAGPAPAGDAHVDLACQAACKHTVSFTSGGCAASGTMRVYTAEPAPVATLIGEYPWSIDKPVTIGPTACARLVAEVDAGDCGTTIASLPAGAMLNKEKVALAPLVAVTLQVNDADGKPIGGAYVSDDAVRTQHTDATGKLVLHRPKDAPSMVWVQATGFGGGLFVVPKAPETTPPLDGAPAKALSEAAAEGLVPALTMSVTLLPTKPVTVTCTQTGAPCAGPMVMVGSGLDARTCAPNSASEWVCDATSEDSVWARSGTALTPKMKVEGKEAVNVGF